MQAFYGKASTPQHSSEMPWQLHRHMEGHGVALRQQKGPFKLRRTAGKKFKRAFSYREDIF